MKENNDKLILKLAMNEAIKYKYVETIETEKEIFLELTKKGRRFIELYEHEARHDKDSYYNKLSKKDKTYFDNLYGFLNAGSECPCCKSRGENKYPTFDYNQVKYTSLENFDYERNSKFLNSKVFK